MKAQLAPNKSKRLLSGKTSIAPIFLVLAVLRRNKCLITPNKNLTRQ